MTFIGGRKLANNEGDERLLELLTAAQMTGWTRSMVIWNTVGTVAGAVVGLSALAIALLALFS
jgi:hypothetical protein